MAISIGVASILVLYVGLMGFLFWFCVIADPHTSPIARFVGHTLPSKAMEIIGKVVGPKGVKIIEAFMERLLAIIYLTVVLGCFGLLHTFGYPWARSSRHIPNYHLTIGYGVLIAALGTWRLAMTTSPGIINQATLQYYDHYPYDNLLYEEGRKDRKKGIPRVPRSKYDRLKYHQHVPRFDHFCGWIFNTVGEENYRFFLLFVFMQFIMCTYTSVMLFRLFMGEVEDRQLFEVTFFDRATGNEFKASKWIVFQYLFHKHLYEAGILAIVAVMGVALLGFLGYHFYITSRGMTTNEHYKWGEVRKWHKGRVKKYQEFLKQQEQNKAKDGISSDKTTSESSTTTKTATTINNNDTDKNLTNSTNGGTASKPHVPDGDVTCTGGNSKDNKDISQTGSRQEEQEEEESDIIEDPGPMPQNIYNCGFVENWKQVLFPQSLQRKGAAAKANEKPKAT